MPSKTLAREGSARRTTESASSPSASAFDRSDAPGAMLELARTTSPSKLKTKATSVPAAVEEQLQASPLSGDDKATLRKLAAGDYGDRAAQEARAALEAVHGMSPDAQRAVLDRLVQYPGGFTASSVASIVGSPAWRQLDVQQREQLCQVLGACDLTGTQMLAELCESPSRLSNRDTNGGTLLDNLAQLSTQPLHHAITDGDEDRESLVSGVLAEVTRPDQKVNQSRYQTCTVTSMQYEMCKDNPAEYARLIAGLSSSDGEARMAGGGELELQEEYFKDSVDGDSRTPSEAIFQSAAMEYANGDHSYNATTDKSKDSNWWIIPDREYDGLEADQQVRVASQLFGKEYHSWEAGIPGVSQDKIYDFLANHGTAGNEEPIICRFKCGPADDTYGHAMTFVKAEDGKIFVRNPWGETHSQMEGFELVDSRSGTYSISADEFKWRLKGIVASEEAISSGGNGQTRALPSESATASTANQPTPPLAPNAPKVVDPLLMRFSNLRG